MVVLLLEGDLLFLLLSSLLLCSDDNDDNVEEKDRIRSTAGRRRGCRSPRPHRADWLLCRSTVSSEDERRR